MRFLSERLAVLAYEIIKDYEMVSKEREIYFRALQDLNNMRFETPADFDKAKVIIESALYNEESC